MEEKIIKPLISELNEFFHAELGSEPTLDRLNTGEQEGGLPSILMIRASHAIQKGGSAGQTEVTQSRSA